MEKANLNFKIPAIRVRQEEKAGQAIYTAVVKAKEFFSRPSERFIVDYYEREKEKSAGGGGYQRKLSPQAVNGIKDYILTETMNPLLPTGLLVSARGELEFSEKSNGFGELIVNRPLYVIDGQHRFEAWKSLMEQPQYREDWGNFELPIVVLSNFNKRQEVEQFYVINSRQKRIKTDLAQRNFLQLAADDSTSGLIPERLKWMLYATKIVDALNEKDDNLVWENKIELPNEDADIKKIKIISQASFVSSLKPFFVGRTSVFVPKDERPDIEKWAGIINDFWKIVYKLYPEAIDNYKDYSLLKTVGVFSLHLFFANMIYREDFKDYVNNKEAQREVLKKVEKYLSDAKNSSIKLEFWRSNVPKNVREVGDYASGYSSSSGHNKIVSRIMGINY